MVSMNGSKVMRKLAVALLALSLLGCTSEDAADRDKKSPAEKDAKPVEQVQERQSVAISAQKPNKADSQVDNASVDSAAEVEFGASRQETPAPVPGSVTRNSGVQKPPVIADEAFFPSAALVDYADKVLSWNNRVQDILAHGTLADRVAACKDVYDETWQLPKRPRGAYVRDFAPAPGLIKGSDARRIDALLVTMNKASDEMLRAYGRLETYVRDSFIQDDGKQGRAIIKEISSSYGQYLAARKDFLHILDKKAQEAEDILLQGHPLRRQISLARNIFGKFREIGQLLLTDNPNDVLLRACGDTVGEMLAQASSPPFSASSDYERLYRRFLRSVEKYLKILRRGLNEGLHGVQKRELLVALNDCREQYNIFAAAINKG